MANNSNSAMDTLKGLLGDDADAKIQSVMNSLSSGSSGSSSGTGSSGNTLPLGDGGLEYIMRIKSIIDELGASNNDARSSLLLSLRPYMRNGRQHTIDSAVRLLNLTKLSGLFGK